MAVKGDAVVAKNFAAVDATLAHLSELKIPASATNPQDRAAVVGARRRNSCGASRR